MDEYERVVKTVHCKRAAAFGVNSIDQQHHPLVLKVLFYHGNAPLRMSLHSSEMSQDPEFDRFIQANPLILIDLHKQSLSHLITHTDTLGSTECVLKILSEKELIRNMFQDTSFLHPYTLHLSTDFKELLQFIIFDVIRKNEPMAQVSTEQIIDRLALILQLQSEHMITIADSLRAEGRRTGEKIGIEKGRAEGVNIGMEKGRKAGILEAAKNMFRQNFDINIIGQVTGLPRAQLLRLAI